jgi:WD40 repeat protein
MKTHSKLLALLLLTISGARILAQAPVLPPGEKEPLLRLEAGGPTSFVTALAFSPDGKLLYVGGWDKVVRVWRLDAAGKFVLDDTAYRVPLGPGLGGAINSIALSDDGTWLAVAGLGVFRGAAGFRERGWVFPSDAALAPLMREDQGTIYVFNTKTQAVRLLRGHAGPVLSLTFAPDQPGKPALLVSAAGEWDADAGRYVGALRLWDVEKNAYLDGNYLDTFWKSGADVSGPGLAAWHTGKRWQQLRVAVAWDDGTFRVWDVDRAQDRVWKLKDQKYNITAAYAAGQGHVITAGYGIGKARLRVWNVPPGEKPQAEPLPPLPPKQVDSVARALALVASQADGNLNYAAVIVSVPKGSVSEYRLQLLNLGGRNLGTVAAEQTLWTGTPRQPVVATAPRGRYLAVAGNDSHDVLVYSIQDLLNQRGQAQTLRSMGTAFWFVAFVSKGKDLGLLLREKGVRTLFDPTKKLTLGVEKGPDTFFAAGDLIFDFAQRRLTADRTGWKTTATALGGWRIERTAEEGWTVIAVWQGDRLVQKVRLKANHVISDFALLGPQPPLTVPILAIASHENGQPVLCLYNAATGERLRYLTGHQGPIHCLAFSADGRFLVSAAEDQSICVWSLTNLAKLIGQYGQLPGVSVTQDKDVLVVSEVQDDSPARGKLAKGDVIEGFLTANKARDLKSLQDFYEASLLAKPGSAVTLQIRGRQGPRKVKLGMGQGIDERKPLLSLFIARDGKPEEREWIGWNPVGPYEASGRQAERHLGWHFNTGQAKSPTRFALADQYRNDYYREGLLKDLIARGEFQRVPPAPPLPPPEMSLLIEEQGNYPNPDGHGQILVRQPNVALKLAIHGRPLTSLESLTWKLDDQAVQKLDLEKVPSNELTVPLQLRRGLHKVRVVARTPDSGGQEFVEEVLLRYQPPPPQVEWKGAKSLVVRDPGFDLEAIVRPGLSGEDVRVQLTQQHNDELAVPESKTYTIDPRQPLTFKKKLTLQPGNNLIKILARNRDALPDYQEMETAQAALEVTLIKKSPPPLIVLESVRPLDKQPELAIAPGKTVQVPSPKIVIRGKINAAEGENLVKAEWTQDPQTKATQLANFTPNKEKQLLINAEIHLQPGPQTLRFRAQTATSDEAEKSVTVYYQPPLPPVEVVAPQRGSIRYGEKEGQEIELRARLGPTGHPYRPQAKILLDGKEVSHPFLAIDKEMAGLTGKISLHPGNNRIQLQLRNEWGAVSTTEDINISYLRPPEVLELKAPRESKEPFLDLAARVRSALPLLLSSITVEVNGKKRDIQPVLADPPASDGTHVVLLKNVPLDADKEANEVSVRLANEEAECSTPAVASILYRPVKPPPVVDFIQPRESIAVDVAKLEVRFQVRSGSPLRKVHLLQEGGKPLAIDLSRLRPNPDGSYSLNTQKDVQLRRGLNTLRVIAANDGGEQDAALIVNFPYRPVRLVIDSLSPIGSDDKPVPAAVRAGGALGFPEMPHGRVRLQGHVAWDEEDDARLKQTKIVRVFVNGFQQLPAILEPGTPLTLPSPPAEGGEGRVRGDGRERAFRVDILLNQAADNRVEIALPGLERDAASRTQFLVNCKYPTRAQRLHLLVVSLDEEDAKGLETQFVRVLAPAFTGVDVYGPQAGYFARRPYVLHQLHIIRDKIQGFANAGLPSTHIVVFYYQGGESVDAQGNFFQTSVNSPNAGAGQTSITCDDLVDFVAQTPGAHVLLFDVDRQRSKSSGAKDKLAGWKDNYPDVESHVAVLRYAWLSTAEAPKSPRLIQALQQALPHATRLVEVVDQLSRLAAQSKYFPDSLRVDRYISDDMKDMVLSKER